LIRLHQSSCLKCGIVHKYLDSDNSGTHPGECKYTLHNNSKFLMIATDCTTDNVSVFQTLVSWLNSNGNRQALLSETGGGNTASCETE
jgi:endoglucanase